MPFVIVVLLIVLGHPVAALIVACLFLLVG